MFYWWQYFRYFIYLAWNWNLRLAIFILHVEIKGEKKYKVHNSGIEKIPTHIPKLQREHASVYQPVNFHTAETLLNHLSDADKTTGFLDAGCGKGRVISMAAHYGFNQIYGFDFAEEFCAASQAVADRMENIFPDCFIKIDCQLADDYLVPHDVGILFLFNPFDHIIMDVFAKNVMQSLAEKPRPFMVLYANPVCKNTWLQLGFKEVFHFTKLTYLEGSIFTYTPQ
ncbi:MAG TPA: class I SAM-dependent methyltransferase [Phnomibacter sp.]|nr:class I SAM-dependent methyltransferase [Phnomibacter sp.]